MHFLKAIADHFKSAPKDKPADRYGILSPLLATGEYVTAAREACTLLAANKYGNEKSFYQEIAAGKTKPADKQVEKAVFAYKDYVKHLPGQEQSLEKAQPFSTIILALESIAGNIVTIEDNFQPLFGTVSQDTSELQLRSSSLVVVGYLEQANTFATWLGSLIEHMTAEAGDMIPPFRTKELLSKAAAMSEFAAFNLNKWNAKSRGFLSEIKEMQRRGSDVALQSTEGEWIDEYAHDSQFSPMEQELMTASLRNPIMMLITYNHVKTQDKIDLLTTRKDWLTSKVIFEQAKMRGLDESSPEYKRLKKITERYATLASRYEQKIERMRA